MMPVLFRAGSGDWILTLARYPSYASVLFVTQRIPENCSTGKMQSSAELISTNLALKEAFVGALAHQKEQATRAELEDLRSMLESRNAEFRLMELRTEELEAELATARELSAMHEHLKAELEEARKQRDDVELMVTSLKERAEKAEKALEEDRARLEEERTALEKSMQRRKEQEVLIPLISEPEIEKQVVSENLTSLIDLTSSTALEMTTSDELQQLRAEIAQLNNVNAQLSNRIQQLEVEKSAIENTQGKSAKLLDELASAGAGHFDRAAMLDKLERLEAETQDVVLDMSEKAENAELENIRLTKELKKNMLEIEKARVHREDLETQLRELKALFAERHPNASESEMMTHIEQEHLSGARGDEKVHIKSSLEEELEKAQSRLAEAKQQYDAEAAQLNEQIRDLISEKEVVESRRAESEYQRAALEEQVKALNEEIRQLTELVAAEKCRADDDLAELEQLRSGTETQIQNMVAQLRTSEEKLLEKEQELEESKRAQAESAAMVSNLESELATLKQQLEENTRKSAEDSERLLQRRLKSENVIKELRAEIEKIHAQHKETSIVDDMKLKAAEDQIAQLKADSEKASNSVVEIQAKLLVAEEKLRNVEKTREQEKSEDERIREQYANALENLKSELAEAHNRLKSTEASESECEKLRAELDQVKKQWEEEVAKQKEESETAVQEFKTRAEKKLAKIKAAAEKDVTSAKAELLLEMDELRRNLSDRDRRIDELVVEKARMEQQIIGQQEMEKELEQRRAKEKELSDFRKNAERRVVELETENRLLGEKNAELSKYKEENDARVEESGRNIQELQDKIKSLEDANEEGFRKAAAKHDSDNKKAVRELQREVKQLYVELNEKTEALDMANARLAELESSSSKEDEEVVEKQTHQTVDASPNYGYEEELESMRKKLKDTHREVDTLREANARLERLMDQQNKTNANSPAIIHVNGGDCVGFADPAEAEYLKNVLYRYMYSRENLGKEAVTLARVIGTVAKFSKSEMENVITREESRVAGWVGGTVSHVLTGR
ncbi:GRIP domain protein [Ancylostoma ceylanicum]|uniref:GRIP domain protein n=1 Tax=Ancylostoma ceylanicum TaxID=53326 RepID=A0A0D6LJF4_9BILA|nr:GRIP domain protein [Ancylostoma ceylanicum]